MFTPRTATGLTIALLALPATATAAPLTDSSGGGGGSTPAHANSHRAYNNYYGAAGLIQPNPDQRSHASTSSLAGTTSQSFVGPDAADAARAGDIAKAMEHYQRAHPVPATARPTSAPADDHAPPWPEIAFGGLVLLATAGGVVRARLRRAHRVAA